MRKIALFFGLLGCLLPLQGFASSQMEHAGHGQADHGSMHSSNSPSMMGQGESFMLGETEVEGVKAMAHISDVAALLAKAGKQENYHLMLMFADASSGAPIGDGVVAVKVLAPDQKELGKPVPLMGMGGHFGVDLHLLTKGTYTFDIGTKLADGKKRQFQFQFDYK